MHQSTVQIFDMTVGSACWHDDTIVVHDTSGDKLVINGIEREDLIQMFRNAFCADDAPSDFEIENLPPYSREMLCAIAKKISTYGSIDIPVIE